MPAFVNPLSMLFYYTAGENSIAPHRLVGRPASADGCLLLFRKGPKNNTLEQNFISHVLLKGGISTKIDTK
jgi:hypothetical protein